MADKILTLEQIAAEGLGMSVGEVEKMSLEEFQNAARKQLDERRRRPLERREDRFVGRQRWKWDSLWKCYRNGRKSIYLGDDGQFTISFAQCWMDGVFNTFEEAAKEFLRPTVR